MSGSEITRFLGKQIRRSRPLLGCGLTFGRVVPLLSFIRTVCMYLVLRSMYDPTLERYTTRDYPGGVIVWYVGAKSLVGDRSVTKPQVRGLKFGTSRYHGIVRLTCVPHSHGLGVTPTP